MATAIAPSPNAVVINGALLQQLAAALRSNTFAEGHSAMLRAGRYDAHGVLATLLNVEHYRSPIKDTRAFAFRRRAAPHTVELSATLPPVWWQEEHMGFEYNRIPEYLEAWQRAEFPGCTPVRRLSDLSDLRCYRHADIAACIDAFLDCVRAGELPEFQVA